MKPLFLLASGSIWVVSILFAWGAIAQPNPSGTWLDGTDQWNVPGATLPQAPAYPEGNNLVNCELGRRIASLPEDAQVEAAGWTLTGAAQVHGATTVITGMADADGMCRPLAYQVFVFTNGNFSGTLSPIPMDSRTDGSLFDVNLYRDDFIDASFNRYTPEDPLCCASGQSRLFYQIEEEGNQAVLVPQLPASTSSAETNATVPAETADSPTAQNTTTPSSPSDVALSNLQTYDGPATGIPIQAHYPADLMEVSGTGSSEGVGVFFTFKPQGTHLDEAEVHVFLPAGAATAAVQEPFVTGPGGLMESNGWIVDSIQADGSTTFSYPWVEQVINFSTHNEESGHVLLGQVDGQAVQVTLFYPAEMSDAYWSAARTVLDSLEFDAHLLPISPSE